MLGVGLEQRNQARERTGDKLLQRNRRREIYESYGSLNSSSLFSWTRSQHPFVVDIEHYSVLTVTAGLGIFSLGWKPLRRDYYRNH